MPGAAEPTLAGNVVKQYLGNHPETKSRTLARIIFNECPGIFASVELAYKMVRYYRGATGKKARKLIKSTEHFRITDTFNPFNLPLSNKQREIYPFKLPPEFKNVLIISDLHIPYHDLEAITIAFEYAQKNNIDSLIVNGDGMDFFTVSRHCKDMRLVDLDDELDQGAKFVESAGKLFKNKIWKDGNHEERWLAHLFRQGQELSRSKRFMNAVDLPTLLEYDKHGFQYVHGRAEIHAGSNFTIVHGHEFSAGESIYSPVNPARGLYLRYEHNAICGHYHRPSQHSQKTGRGQIRGTWSLGCMCLLRPEYATQNKWIHGFAHLTIDGDDFHLRNFKIVNGEIYES